MEGGEYLSYLVLHFLPFISNSSVFLYKVFDTARAAESQHSVAEVRFHLLHDGSKERWDEWLDDGGGFGAQSILRIFYLVNCAVNATV